MLKLYAINGVNASFFILIIKGKVPVVVMHSFLYTIPEEKRFEVSDEAHSVSEKYSTPQYSIIFEVAFITSEVSIFLQDWL